MQRYYDLQKKRLIYFGKKPSRQFWDSHWDLAENEIIKIVSTRRNFASLVTAKYLKPEHGIILEGGCGTGENVAALVNNGYRCIGIDWAEKTVALLNKYAAGLDIRQGDVRKLPFPDKYFTGYWSMGVIEHFWDGYEPIAREMARVIKQGGFLFLSFPYMSPLRKLKAALGLYGSREGEQAEGGFYQFAIEKNGVISYFEKFGFSLVRTYPHSSVKGLKDEVSLLKPWLQHLYDYSGNNRMINFLKSYLSIALAPVTSHCILLVLKKIHSNG